MRADLKALVNCKLVNARGKSGCLYAAGRSKPRFASVLNDRETCCAEVILILDGDVDGEGWDDGKGNKPAICQHADGVSVTDAGVRCRRGFFSEDRACEECEYQQRQQLRKQKASTAHRRCEGFALFSYVYENAADQDQSDSD